MSKTERSNDKTLIVNVNPLSFTKKIHPYQKNESITEKDIVEYVCGHTMIPEPQNMIKHYEELQEKISQIFAIPAEYQLNTKLVQPLKQAIGSFILGNYLATIAMTGFVSEMLTNFIYETSNIQINEKPISLVEKKLFGRTFEKQGQERRLAILKGFSVIDDDIFQNFENIRKIRARYLHGFSLKHEQIAPDAKQILQNCLDLFISIVGQQINDGKVYYSPNMVRYLESKNLLHESD